MTASCRAGIFQDCYWEPGTPLRQEFIQSIHLYSFLFIFIHFYLFLFVIHLNFSLLYYFIFSFITSFNYCSFSLLKMNVVSRFVNTTCEIKLVNSAPSSDKYSQTADHFLILGEFDKFGIAEGTLDPELGKVETFRLNIHSASDNWAILSEIMFSPS